MNRSPAMAKRVLGGSQCGRLYYSRTEIKVPFLYRFVARALHRGTAAINQPVHADSHIRHFAPKTSIGRPLPYNIIYYLWFTKYKYVMYIYTLSEKTASARPRRRARRQSSNAIVCHIHTSAKDTRPVRPTVRDGTVRFYAFRVRCKRRNMCVRA